MNALSRSSSPWPFFVLALGWSWLLWIPLTLLGYPITALPGALMFALGGLGPALAAVLLTSRESPQARRDYWRRVIDVKRISLGWYAVIFLVPLALNGLGILTGALLGAGPPSFDRAAEVLASPLAVVPLAVFILFFGPLPEELGWRGYALDRLVLSHSALTSSLILGLIWLLWHLPQFFMAGSYIESAFPIGTAVFWVGWALPTVASSVIYTWIYAHTGRSTLAAILFHFAVNFTGEFFTVRDEFTLYRAIWVVLLAVAIVVWAPRSLTGEPRSSRPVLNPSRGGR